MNRILYELYQRGQYTEHGLLKQNCYRKKDGEEALLLGSIK